ncbi:MAG TPA: folylpolyglutamate synthase/dihydrofolate synthase family protein [Pyrinomonadaceae bacterium]|nr:folylpolyglutamate synthase/dihydrofolate synthase family protein [Pyrinomonadaceae bacterium]
MLFDEANRYLLSLGHETLTIKLGLENTETLLEALGNPHKNFPSVQIAGTNGKGSTAAFLDSICRAAGIRTGLFISPHLISITERIRVAGESIIEEEFARFTSIVRSTAETLVSEGKLDTLPTFFEHVTAIALLAFREARVELAILETGLGGRLDSTTAARAKVVAITPIAMDHEEYLGHTIEEIATEKAAIIRPGVAAIIAPQEPAALNVIRRRCETVGVEPRLVDPASIEGATIGLRGRHQQINAAIAIALAEALGERGFNIANDAVIAGLEEATHPGRLELWPGSPPILFDGAHNPASAQALRNYLDEFVSQPITMIFGAMRDKRLTEIGATLFPKADRLILTGIDNPRAASFEDLESAAPREFDRSKIYAAASPRDALGIAHDLTTNEGMILITGSLYLVGAAQKILQPQTA